MMVPVPTVAPQHMVMRGVLRSRRSSSWRAVMIRREPVAPTGWPRAMAPPFTFSLSMSGSKTFSQESTTAAKASVTS